jgi:hypothetical protein
LAALTNILFSYPRYADRAKKIQNKPVINTVDHQAVKLASMQERIDFLEKRLKNQQDGTSTKDGSKDLMKGPGPGFMGLRSGSDNEILARMVESASEMDNDQWMSYFVEELKNRTIRGTSGYR